MAREAVTDDLDELVALCERFHGSTIHAGQPYDGEHFRQQCAAYIDAPDYVLLIGKDAMCAGMVGLHPASGARMASEIFLYSEGAAQGLKLLKALKAWASKRGARQLILTDQMNMRSLAPLYQRIGAKEIERVYMAEL